MARTRVKICGMTNREVALHAAAEGVDALGFIFAPKSPRYISPTGARDIISDLPPFVDRVGVFLNEPQKDVEEIASYCGLTTLQLHGSESPEDCETLPYKIIKSFQMKPDFDYSLLKEYEDRVSAFLFDTYHKDKAGGTGEIFDWSLVGSLDTDLPVILAGGLGTENVVQAIKEVRPFAVDVNSTLETEPGVKDLELISRLLANVNSLSGTI
ncbi:MAG: phosphoribosylanthranilate isomerase [Desulfurivibrionaceae bacterium]